MTGLGSPGESRDPADPDRVTALGESPLTELREKGSRFLARVHPCPDRLALDHVLAREREAFPDATHHCWGARLLDEDRCDDDGEPMGTAGPPILRVLEGAGVRGACCVVIRYYGGTKLGTGGLIRAYGDAAKEAIAAAPVTTTWRTARGEVPVAFEDLGAVEGVLRKLEAHLLDVSRRFDPEPVFTLAIKESRVPEVERTLRDATAGRARLRRIEDGPSEE